MRFLFVHPTFPGQYLYLVQHLVRQRRHEVVFLSEPNRNVIHGVRRIHYRQPDPTPDTTHPAARAFDAAVRRAEIVAAAARDLRENGFRPDIILGHHGWGDLLNLGDVWPDVPMLGYFEFFHRTEGSTVGFDPEFPTDDADHPSIRARNAPNLAALALEQHGQTPTQWQLAGYPAWARSRIAVLPEGVDLTLCRPDPALRQTPLAIGKTVIAPEHRLVTYVSRSLEPFRGFHTMMRAVPAILAAGPDIRIVLVGGEDVSYSPPPKEGSWLQTMLSELGDRVDPARVVFPGRVDYDTHVSLLKRSDAHVYLSYPGVASWSLREAIACGTPLVAADIEMVREFVTHDHNGLLVPCLEPERVAENVVRLLEDVPLARRLGDQGRKMAEATLDLRVYLAAYEALINRVTGGA